MDAAVQTCSPLSPPDISPLSLNDQSLAVAGGGVGSLVQTVSPGKPGPGGLSRPGPGDINDWSPGLVSLVSVLCPLCLYLPPSPQMSSLQSPFVQAPGAQDGHTDCFRKIKMIKTVRVL